MSYSAVPQRIRIRGSISESATMENCCAGSGEWGGPLFWRMPGSRRPTFIGTFDHNHTGETDRPHAAMIWTRDREGPPVAGLLLFAVIHVCIARVGNSPRKGMAEAVSWEFLLESLHWQDRKELCGNAQSAFIASIASILLTVAADSCPY